MVIFSPFALSSDNLFSLVIGVKQPAHRQPAPTSDETKNLDQKRYIEKIHPLLSLSLALRRGAGVQGDSVP